VAIRANLTPKQKAIATFWAGGQGTPLPPGVWNQVMFGYVRGKKLSVPSQTRVFALLNVAMDDAGIASWDTKYTYWNPRPQNAIRALGLDRHWTSFIATPFFPAYVSGHSTYSSAAGEVLAHLFPEDAKLWRAKGREAGYSRLLGGIHWSSDNVYGTRIGLAIGRLVVNHAKHDGAET
jgi:membrane-associated phospholipid phosphatase